jgi:hypothetical protein
MKKNMRQVVWKNGLICLAVLAFLIMGCVSQVKTPDVKTKHADLAAGISGIKVQNTKGEPVELESLWSNRRVVIVFLRHFGCMFCRQQAASFMGIKDQLDHAGVALVAIGSGTPQQAQDFAKKFKFEGELYVSQDLSAYKAFYLQRGFCRTLGPKSLWRGVGTLTKGFHQGLKAGDLWQQGGVFVIGPGNQVFFEHIDSYAGENVNLQEVIAASLSGNKEEVVAIKVEQPVVQKDAVVAPKVEGPVAPKEVVVAAPAAADKSPAPVVSKQNEIKDLPADAVKNLVNRWLNSWKSGDMKTYSSFYASDFKSKGRNLDAWISYKTKVHQKSKNVDISIDNLKISLDGNTASAVFTQHYSSSIFKDSGKKTLKLRKINNEWKIYKEII